MPDPFRGVTNGLGGISLPDDAPIRCEPMPGEAIWSHAARLAWVNGERSQIQLSKATYGEARASPRRREPWLAFLADCAGLPVFQYAVRHSLAGLLELDAYEGQETGSRVPLREASDELKLHDSALACPNCREADIDRFGFSWFRREHQLPGIFRCVHHGGDLLEVSGTKPLNHILTLNDGSFACSKLSADVRANEFVQTYQAHLFNLIGIKRPVDWKELRHRIANSIRMELRKRGMPRFGSLYQWVLADAPDNWLASLVHLDGSLPRRISNPMRSRLSASDLALIFACHRTEQNPAGRAEFNVPSDPSSGAV